MSPPHPPPPHPLPPQPQSGKAAGKKAAAPAKGKGKAAPAKKAGEALYPSKPKSFRIGGSILPTGRDLSRFVKWPVNVRLQRQRKILYERLKTPPAVAQFKKPFDRAEALPLLKLLAKYKPESAAAKKARLVAGAAAKAAGTPLERGPKPVLIKTGLSHVTYLVENKKAKFVIIASDVEPLELVIWLPALCRRMGIPYAIVANKGVLGSLVGFKTAAALALTAVRKEDEAALAKIIESADAKFANNVEARRKWGGGIMGAKTQAALTKRAALLAAELAKKSLL